MSVVKLKSSSSIDSWIDEIDSGSSGAARTSSLASEIVLPARSGTTMIPASLSIYMAFIRDVHYPRLEFPSSIKICTSSTTFNLSLEYTFQLIINDSFFCNKFIMNIT